MNFDLEKTKECFQKNGKNKLIIDFLLQKGINSQDYIDFFKINGGGFLQYNTLLINGEEFTIDTFLGSSNETIYDLIKTNKMMNLDNSKLIAIATCVGDDLICLKPHDQGVYFCQLDDIDGDNLFKLAEDFNSFLKLVR